MNTGFTDVTEMSTADLHALLQYIREQIRSQADRAGEAQVFISRDQEANRERLTHLRDRVKEELDRRLSELLENAP